MQWRRSAGAWKSKHFSAREFVCRCGMCSQQIISDQLVEKLDELREELGIPVTVTSGFRCGRYQQQLREQGYETASGKSSHEMGIAADLSCSDMSALILAAKRFFPNVGVGKTFVHVDLRPGGPRSWGYKA